MKVIRKLNCTKNDFFQLLEISIINDYYQNTNKKIKEVKEGMKYNKTLTTKMKNTGNVNVLIKKFDKNSLYEVHYITDTSTNIVKYTLLEESNVLTVCYEEESIEKNTLLKINNSIMSMFFVRKAKKRINQMFNNIESTLDKEVIING